MPFDALTLKYITHELNLLVDGRINKIYQPDKDQILFAVRKNSQVYKLLVCVNANFPSLHLTQAEFENPANAPSFCMNLRKHLTNGKIISVLQVPYERIVKITVSSNSEMRDSQTFTLYAEIMGKYSNLLLVDSDNIIKCSLKQVSLDMSSVRQTFVGLPYLPPPISTKPNLSESDRLTDLLGKYDGTVKLSNFLYSSASGISKQTATEIAVRSNAPDAKLLPQQINDILNAIKYLDNADNINPHILQNGQSSDFFAVRYVSVDGLTATDTISQAIDRCITLKTQGKLTNAVAQRLQATLNTLIKRQQKTNAILKERIDSCLDYQTNKQFGDLILSNLHKIKRGDKTVNAENFFNELGGCVDIPLDDKLTPQQNAARYYKKYNKQKTSLVMSHQQIEHCANMLEYLLGLSDSLRVCQTKEEFEQIQDEMASQKLIPAQKTVGKPKQEKMQLMTVECQGYKILVGKNNKQNEYITHKLANPDDIWLHVKNSSGSHTLICTEKRAVSDAVIEAAAKYAVMYSRASGGKTQVDYCLAKYVKKLPPTPGNVTYTNYKTILVEP